MIESLVTTGWPSNKTIFEHAAYELLKWHAEHRDEFANNMAANPGADGL